MRRHSHEGQKSLGAAIRNLRKQKGLTQDQLGKRSEIHGTQINRIEKGYVDPTFGNARRIAEALGVGLSLLSEEEARIEGRLGLPPRLGEVSAIDVGVQFGQNIRLVRQGTGLSQRRLAERCGMQEETVGRIERGSSLPKLHTIVKLVNSLDTTPGELFETLPLWVPKEDGAGSFVMPDLGRAAA